MICRALLFYAVFPVLTAIESGCAWKLIGRSRLYPSTEIVLFLDLFYFCFFFFFFFFFLAFPFFFFFLFSFFPLKKSLMRFPIGQIWSDPRSLIFHFFLFISAQKQHGDISFSTRHTHKHILRAHTNRRDEDWHFSWSRPFNSNGTTLTQSYRKKWLSNQMASSTDLTRQHRR